MRKDDVDTWSVQTEHDDDPFQSVNADVVLDSLRETVDDWMRSPIADGETLTITVRYRSVTSEKIREWKNHGLI